LAFPGLAKRARRGATRGANKDKSQRVQAARTPHRSWNQGAARQKE
jgi:hypothetical protein